MNYTYGEARQKILKVYDECTSVEKSIADFFLNNTKKINFQSKNLSKLLYVSEATLSRFAQKCGFKGYRELIFVYQKDLESTVAEKDISMLSAQVRNLYWKLLEESYALLDEAQMKRISNMVNHCRRVCVYGMGSSGFAASEFRLRFMRTGLLVETATDSQMIRMCSSLLAPEDLLIAISLSGKSAEILSAVQLAKEHGAKVVLVTSNPDIAEKEFCDEILTVASTKNLETGTMISPQFPILVMMDIFYTYYMENDSFFKFQKHKETLYALKKPFNY